MNINQLNVVSLIFLKLNTSFIKILGNRWSR